MSVRFTGHRCRQLETPHREKGCAVQPGEDRKTVHHFEVFADYRQVYLEDCRLHEELTRLEGRDPQIRLQEIDAWVAAVLSPAAQARHLGLARGTLCILTARNCTVPLDVEIQAAAPDPDEFAGWDHVVEAGLDLPSGCILIRGATDGLAVGRPIDVVPGIYRVRVYYGGISTVSEDRLEGEDHYRVALWPTPVPIASPVVVHSHVVGIW
jgi:hypothetical protein